MQTSARRAAGPSLEMFRMNARGMRTAIWMAIRDLVVRGSEPLVTASVSASQHCCGFGCVR